MNALTVVLILFSAALITTVLLAVFRKKSRKMWIGVSAALIPAALVSVLVVNAVFAQMPASVSAESTAAAVLADPDKGYLDMAFALTSQGETAGAETVLNEYAQSYPMNEKYFLAKARNEAVRKNYAEADSIYKYLEQATSADKERFTQEHNEVKLLMNGGGTYEKLTELIVREINGLSVSPDAINAARLYSEVDAMDVDSASASYAEEVVEKYKKALEAYPHLFDSSAMELNYLKALAAAKDYASIVDRSLGLTDSHSLLILAELSRSGKITSGMLRDSDVNARVRDKNERILKWIEEQEKSNDFKEDEELIKEAKNMLEHSDISTPKLFKSWLKVQLLALARSPEEKEAAKLYLELIRMNYSDEKTDGNNEYIRQVLLTANRSEDADFANAVAAVNEILGDKDNTESLKNIDMYVEQMVENMNTREMKADFGTDLSPEDRRFAQEITTSIFGADIGEESSSEQSGNVDPIGMSAYGEPEIGLMDYEFDSEYDDDSSDTADKRAFSSYVTVQVNQITASINISSVNASEAEKVTLIVAADESIADTVESFRSNIEIYDCGTEIKDYTVEKIEDEKFNIILVCDNSGSMSGSDKIGSLKSALGIFLNNLSEDVRVGIVSFDDGIINKASASLGSDVSALRNAISGMGAYGGTDIYDGVKTAMEQAKAGDGINIMIVMSDGQDNLPNDEALRALKNDCSLKDVVIYSMGLGYDVDSDVLSAYSAVGGGSYTYVSDANALLSFYQYLYGISRNRYRVTYTAQDKLLVNRTAMAAYRTDSKVYDTQPYSVGGQDDEPAGTELSYEIPLQNIRIKGLDTRLLYRSSSDQVIHLSGEGLTEDVAVSVTIRSGLSVDLKTEYESDTSRKVTVPADTAEGEYDVIVKVNGRRCTFASGLVIASPRRSGTLRFGEYVFTASSVSYLSNEIQLSGNVYMNGWLGFAGGLIIRGDLSYDDSILISANDAYVSYNNSPSLNAYAKQIAQNGSIISIGGINDLRLYRNSGTPASSDLFDVDSFYAPFFELPGLTMLKDCSMCVYPDRLTVGYDEFIPSLPMQSDILRMRNEDSFYSFGNESYDTAVLNKTSVVCRPECYESDESSDMRPAKLGNMSISIDLRSYEMKLDTEAGQYYQKFRASIEGLSDDLTLYLGWEDGKLKTVSLSGNAPFETVIGGVKMTFSDLVMKTDDAANKALYDVKLDGSCKITVPVNSGAGNAKELVYNDVQLSYTMTDRAFTVKEKTDTGLSKLIQSYPAVLSADPFSSGRALGAVVVVSALNEILTAKAVTAV